MDHFFGWKTEKILYYFQFNFGNSWTVHFTENWTWWKLLQKNTLSLLSQFSPISACCWYPRHIQCFPGKFIWPVIQRLPKSQEIVIQGAKSTLDQNGKFLMLQNQQQKIFYILSLQPLRLDIKRRLTARSDRVKCCDLHPTEPWMLASLYNGNVHVWNHDNQTLVKSFEVCDLPVRASKFVPRKNWVITGSDDMQVNLSFQA